MGSGRYHSNLSSCTTNFSAIPIGGFNLTEVGREKVDKSCPSFILIDVEATGSAETHRKSLYMLLGHKQYDLDKRMVKPGDIAANQTFNLVVRRNTKENNDYRLSSASPPIKDCCRVGKSIRCWPSGRGLRIDGVPETVKTRVTSHVITSLLKLHPNKRVIVLAHHNAALKEL
ncbi:hypothetical protein BLNAU_13616 [Blattamonas nauphoetae]|uniref:Uncharacterized protein n=1 Tax=Blattamonas nauphoetae TaxID=2049346 RepID=A0ABQ9XKV0_9EUKA|nr:hypothetical protein BLNAU_13616 [Blattamonas nauphoetae]